MLAGTMPAQKQKKEGKEGETKEGTERWLYITYAIEMFTNLLRKSVVGYPLRDRMN